MKIKPDKKINLKWFEFNQNNSGGWFVVDKNLCERLYIQAESQAESIAIAETLGVYFNGVENEIDCGCCGDRWYTPIENKEQERIEEIAQDWAIRYGSWTTPACRFFYADGSVKEIFGERKDE